jgi:hypothetical protein
MDSSKRAEVASCKLQVAKRHGATAGAPGIVAVPRKMAMGGYLDGFAGKRAVTVAVI